MDEFNRNLYDRDFLFVWRKNGGCKVFNLNHANRYEPSLKQQGWRHASTIDASLWVEAILTCSDQDALKMIQDAKGESRVAL